MTRKRPQPCALALVALLACSANRAEAQPSEERAALLERLSRGPEQRAHTWVREAAALMSAAAPSIGDYGYLCRRTLEAPGGASALGSMRARGRALRQLAKESFQRKAAVRSAIARLERALELTPNDPNILHLHARALASLQEPRGADTCEVSRQDPEAIAALESLRAAHPDFSPSEIAFELGVMRTRAGRLRAAQRGYEQAIALASDPGATAIARTNLAEVTMLLEELEPALEHYDRALSVATRPREQALAALGRAVALDRLGDHAAAVDQLRRAFGTTRAGLDALRAPGVFFEPPRELSYYDALAHEALASRAKEPERSVLLRSALTSYRAFLSEHPPRSLAAAAQTGVTRVERMLSTASEP
jgi:tetratricopeptide (TPR) repeat protein